MQRQSILNSQSSSSNNNSSQDNVYTQQQPPQRPLAQRSNSTSVLRYSQSPAPPLFRMNSLNFRDSSGGIGNVSSSGSNRGMLMDQHTHQRGAATGMIDGRGGYMHQQHFHLSDSPVSTPRQDFSSNPFGSLNNAEKIAEDTLRHHAEFRLRQAELKCWTSFAPVPSRYNGYLIPVIPDFSRFE
ncbi:12536_t:CDS:2 [Ambispora leptoticha]|uniref:12536_t:CDS:1 n=1 Tax=Ambispora leptoticha TaxID=144679 RepID=A0A9N9AC94_9GLOM|nr:12536_t:CDS:2 [Ambispora leptoticha]